MASLKGRILEASFNLLSGFRFKTLTNLMRSSQQKLTFPSPNVSCGKLSNQLHVSLFSPLYFSLKINSFLPICLVNSFIVNGQNGQNERGAAIAAESL